MSSVAAVGVRRPVLADLVPGSRVRDLAVVVGGALLTAAAAQVAIPLPFTPVPLTGQTFGVLLVAAVAGPTRGTLSQLVYVLLGAVGLPFYAGGEHGWQVATGPTGGYLAGFVVAAALVGWCARRGWDRSPARTAGAFLAGNLVIYLFGVMWLWLSVPAISTPAQAIAAGLTPFIVGDAVKIALAMALLPLAWRLLPRSG